LPLSSITTPLGHGKVGKSEWNEASTHGVIVFMNSMARLAAHILIGGQLFLNPRWTEATHVASGKERKTSPRETSVSFSSLERGDTLWISYSSSGCFHRFHAEITILGSDPSVAEVRDLNLSIFGPQGEPKVRTIKLTNQDRDGLDRLIQFYESGPTQGCTTVERVELTLSHRRVRIPTLSFVDGSCESFSYPGVVTLHEIVHRGS
jgi:hypothetical protein